MVMVVWWRASFAKCVACESQLRRVIARMTVAFRPRLSPARFSELTNRNVTDIFGCLERNGTSRWHRRTCGFGPLRGRGLDAGNGDMPVREAGWTRIGQGCVLPATRNEASAVACTRSEAPGGNLRTGRSGRRQALRAPRPCTWRLLPSGWCGKRRGNKKKARCASTGLFVRRQNRAPHPGKSTSDGYQVGFASVKRILVCGPEFVA